jgi:hypothetical protein
METVGGKNATTDIVLIATLEDLTESGMKYRLPQLSARQAGLYHIKPPIKSQLAWKPRGALGLWSRTRQA